MTGDPTLIALAALSALTLAAGTLFGIRRHWGFGSWAVWGGAARTIALLSVSAGLLVIGTVDPAPVIDRIFPDAAAGPRAELMLAYDMTLAREALVTATLAIVIDLTVTFLRVRWLRVTVLAVATLVMLLSAVNAGLFIGALFVQS